MSPRSYRIRRVLLWITLGMLGAVVVAWGVSWVNHTQVEYWHDEAVMPDVLKNNVPISTLVRSRAWLGAFAGELNVTLERNHLYGNKERLSRARAIQSQWRFSSLWFDPAIEATSSRYFWNGYWYWSLPGISLWTDRTPPDFRMELRVSYWLPALAMSALSLWLWWPLGRRSRRMRAGLCTHCAYDRRGLAADAACPECGQWESL